MKKHIKKHSPKNCPYLHVQNCAGCGRSCSCYNRLVSVKEKTMAKKQTRKALSVSGKTYEKLTAFAEANKESRSSVVEKALEDYMDRKDAIEAMTPSRDDKALECLSENAARG